MKYEVTGYGVYKVLRESTNPVDVREIAKLANIDTTSENLREIKDMLLTAMEISKSVESVGYGNKSKYYLSPISLHTW